jgi:glucose-1-phosphate adenylyltransferase
MMDLVQPVPKFNFYQAKRPIYTRPRYLPGAKISGCHVCRTVINEGAILEESFIEDSMIGIRSRIRKGAKITHSVILGRDFYETGEDMKENEKKGIPDTGIGFDCVIEKAIIDKNARIGPNVKILDQGRDREVETENYSIKDGIVIVPKNAIIMPGEVIG